MSAFRKLREKMARLQDSVYSPFVPITFVTEGYSRELNFKSSNFTTFRLQLLSRVRRKYISNNFNVEIMNVEFDLSNDKVALIRICLSILI